MEELELDKALIKDIIIYVYNVIFFILDMFLMNFYSCWDINFKNIFVFDKDVEKAKYDFVYNGLSFINNRVSGDKVKLVSMGEVINLSMILIFFCYFCDIYFICNFNFCIMCYIDFFLCVNLWGYFFDLY